MKTDAFLAIVLSALLAVELPAAALAQAAAPETAPAAADSGRFTQEQLEQLVAPIALYPDSLLMQVLMASTYPLEIVEAQRWVKKNPGLSGDQLEKAMFDQDWDPSVKSLCGFPEALNLLGDNLDWTQDLGDAMLGQQEQLLDAVQVMRGKALDSGNLKTTEQQTVTVEPEKIIVIQPAKPEVIYVPTYSPTVVYGGWYYPHWYWPTLYYPPPPGAGFVAFTAGVFWGAAVWGGCHWGWGRTSVNINVNRYNSFNSRTNINANRYNRPAGDRGSWRHDPQHRKGVNYGNRAVAQQYGGSGASNRVSRDQARGHAPSRPSQGSVRPPSTTAQRPATPTQRPTTPSQRPPSSRPSAYSGSSSPSFDRSASSRGASSRGSSRPSSEPRTSGGGSRGGASRGGRR